MGQLGTATRRHVDGDFEPFAKADRKQIPKALLDQVMEINHLDVRLHEFSMRLFDQRRGCTS
jgi:hypothetical protein